MKSCESLFVLQSCGKRIKKLHARSWQGVNKGSQAQASFSGCTFSSHSFGLQACSCILFADIEQKTLFLFAGIK